MKLEESIGRSDRSRPRVDYARLAGGVQDKEGNENETTPRHGSSKRARSLSSEMEKVQVHQKRSSLGARQENMMLEKISVLTKRTCEEARQQVHGSGGSLAAVFGELDANQGLVPRRKRTSAQLDQGEDEAPKVSALRRRAVDHTHKRQHQEQDNGAVEDADAHDMPAPPPRSADQHFARSADKHDVRSANDQDAGVSSDGVLRIRRVGNAGHITTIRMENFMCHECFEIKMGTHVTLISGSNGSGKSAIMQALQACLGVSARKTGRATNFPAFIRTGADSSRLSVTLSNIGADAYQYERFGAQITIERRLNRNGSNPFKLQDSRGHTVSTKKEEVDAVLDYFSINAANPLTVITQDMARSFLSGGAQNKRDKYAIFMEGTMLDTIKSCIETSDHFQKESFDGLNKSLQELKKMAANVKDCKERLVKLTDMDRLCQLRSDLEHACAWSFAWENNDRIQKLKDDLATKAPQNQDLLKKQIKQKEQQLEVLRAENHRKMLELTEFQTEQQAWQTESDRLKKNAEFADSLRKSIARNLANNRANLENMHKTKQSFTTVLEEDTNEKAAEHRRALEEFERQMAAKTQAVAELEAAYNQVRAEINGLREQQQQLSQQEDGARRSVGGFADQLGRLQQDRQALAHSKKNKLADFGGQAVVTLLQLIKQNARKFSRTPIGPLGAHLGLKDSKWSTSVEVALGFSLDLFVVNSSADAGVLRGLSVQARVNPNKFTIVITNFDIPLHTIPPHRRPPPELTTVMDVISVSGDEVQTRVIMNMLVDRSQVERTVLVDNGIQARDLQRKRVQNVSTLYDVEGTTYKSAANSTVVISKNRNLRPRLGMNHQQQLQQVLETMQKLEGQQQQAHEHLRELQQDASNLGAAISVAAKKEIQLAKSRKLAQIDMRNIEANFKPAAAAADGSSADNAEMVVTQIQQCDIEISATQVEMLAQETQMQEAVQQLQESVASFEKYRRYIADKQAGAGHHEEEITAIARKRKEVTLEQQQLQEKLAKHTDAVTAAAAQLADLTADRQQKLQVAETVCTEEESTAACEEVRKDFTTRVTQRQELERKKNRQSPPLGEEAFQQLIKDSVNNCMHHESLWRELEKTNSKIKAAEREAGGDRAGLEYELQGLQKKEALFKGRFTIARDNFRALEKSCQERKASFETLRDNVKKGSDSKFRQYLARRGHTGRIIVNEDTQELTLEVKIKGVTNKDAKPVSDLKQLSGGERSFTTVAFLLAIGQWTESPFRCMDEFDVFMDAINRRVATETLLEFAYDNSENQYIFLTPQDLQAVEDAKVQLGKRLEVNIPDGFLKTVQMRAARPAANVP